MNLAPASVKETDTTPQLHLLRVYLERLFPLFVIAIFASPTIHMRVELGPLSIALLEPVVLVVSGSFLLYQLITRGRITISTNPIVLPIIGFVVLAFILRPWVGTTRGLSDVRDWLIPTIGMLAILSTIRYRWRVWALLLIFIGFAWSVIGIFQYTTQSYGPFIVDDAIWKTNFNVVGDTLEQSHFASAFFSHPNGLGQFLFFCFLLALGWLFSDRNQRVLKLIVLLTLAVGTYLTFTKTALALTIVFSGFFIVDHLFRRFYDFLFLFLSAIILAIIGGGILYLVLPNAFFVTLYWRFELWEVPFQIIVLHPEVLLFGNGMQYFGEIGFYGQPHNNYIFVFLEYGAIGLILKLLLIFMVLRQGLRARVRGLMHQEPILAALWFILLAFFSIAVVESTFEGIEPRMLFYVFITCFIGLERELRLKPAVNELSTPL